MFPKHFNILVVDDEKGIRDVAKLALEDLGMKIFEARDGKEAVEQAKKHFFALMLTDYDMPKLNGTQATKSVKKHCPWMDVYLMSAFLSEDKIKKAYQAGVRKCFLKPIRPADLEDFFSKALAGKLASLRKQMGFLLKQLSYRIKKDSKKRVQKLYERLRDKDFRYPLTDTLLTDLKVQKLVYNVPVLEIFKNDKFLLLVLKKSKI